MKPGAQVTDPCSKLAWRDSLVVASRAADARRDRGQEKARRTCCQMEVVPPTEMQLAKLSAGFLDGGCARGSSALWEGLVSPGPTAVSSATRRSGRPPPTMTARCRAILAPQPHHDASRGVGAP
jgi:hypothetical protein